MAGSLILNDALWLDILSWVPEASGYFKHYMRYDPTITAIKFGMVDRFAHQLIVKHKLIATKAKELLEKKRQQDRQKRLGRRSMNPRIVQLALDGNLAAVRAELERGTSLESCGRWTETEEKYFYEKSWDWNNDTPLSMACSQGNLALVEILLQLRANPHHRVCNECDVHYTPLTIALQLKHLNCAKAIKRAIHAEEEEKAKKIRDDAITFYSAATDRTLLKQEQEVLVGCWQNRSGRFELKGSEDCTKLHFQELVGDAKTANLLKRCDGWWQGTLHSGDSPTTYIRLKLSNKDRSRGSKVVHETKALESESRTPTPWSLGCRVDWGGAVRSTKLPENVSNEEATRLFYEQQAQREARLEVRREALRQQRRQERQLERERFNQEMYAIDPEWEEDFESESEFLDDEEDNFEDEFDDADETEEEEEEQNVSEKLRFCGGHASLFEMAAKHYQKGEGGTVDLAMSAKLCAATLSLEKDKPAGECSPEYSSFGKAMKILRDLASAGVYEALEILPEFERIDNEKKLEREKRLTELKVKQEAEAQERKQQFEIKQKKREECRRLRQIEVQRCQPLLNQRPRTGTCTDNRTHNEDFCTYKHFELKDLPPHCLHFSNGNCRNGDNCWFNHLRCVCGSCKS
eukprot:TRINITY_DN12943_c1_g1_i1.p1 TRINITY_DN12943_c1_g1~~TRINITY_DN12943_c1_g1_i1.p1  ORF type:complete len:634 (-),score=130.54 TRINITY_DN12943_c1_g1_i1:36-1937(-)